MKEKSQRKNTSKILKLCLTDGFPAGFYKVFWIDPEETAHIV